MSMLTSWILKVGFIETQKAKYGVKETFFCQIEKSLYVKGYLCHKTITSQNVPSKAQIKNIFIS